MLPRLVALLLLGPATGATVRRDINTIVNNALSSINSINGINDIVNNAVNNIYSGPSGINDITNNAVNNITGSALNTVNNNAVNTVTGSGTNTVNSNAVNNIQSAAVAVNAEEETVNSVEADNPDEADNSD